MLKQFSKDGCDMLPLKSVSVTGEFCDCLGEVIVCQKWTNDSTESITARYVFALDSNAVVSDFKMSIGDRSWSGKVKEKSVAKAEYTAAVESGLKSSLLEKVSATDYGVNVGPIEPQDIIEIQFTYLTRAEVRSDGSYHFVLPTNIAPKYSIQPAPKIDRDYAAVMDTIPHISNPPYEFVLDILWRTGSVFQEITSPTNEISSTIIDATTVRVRAVTAPSNGDFTLCVKTEATTSAYVYESPVGDKSSYLYVHNQIPSEITAKVPRKITIVLDRSGSMGGNKITHATRAIKEFLSLLSPDDLINLVGFGCKHRAMWSKHVPASVTNRVICNTHLDTVCQADMGGTELLHCLTAVVCGKYDQFDYAAGVTIATTTAAGAADGDEDGEDSSGYEHIVVLLTDGQVSNLSAITSMLKTQSAAACRMMTIGIGRDADRSLVQSVAETTNGISRMLVDESNLTTALTGIVEYINKQYYTNVRVDKFAATQCSRVLYPAHPLDMFVKLEPHQMSEVAASGHLAITADDPVRGGAKSWTLPVEQCVNASVLVEKLYADGVIRHCESQLSDTALSRLSPEGREGLVIRVVDLSVQYGLMNSRTSYLIVSDEKATLALKTSSGGDNDGVTTTTAVKNVNIPHHSSGGVKITIEEMDVGDATGLFDGIMKTKRKARAQSTNDTSSSSDTGANPHIRGYRYSACRVGPLPTSVAHDVDGSSDTLRCLPMKISHMLTLQQATDGSILYDTYTFALLHCGCVGDFELRLSACALSPEVYTNVFVCEVLLRLLSGKTITLALSEEQRVVVAAASVRLVEYLTALLGAVEYAETMVKASEWSVGQVHSF